MTLSQMKFFDKYAGWLICLLFTLAHGMARGFRTGSAPRRLPARPTVLVMKFWGMGSIVLA